MRACVFVSPLLRLKKGKRKKKKRKKEKKKKRGGRGGQEERRSSMVTCRERAEVCDERRTEGRRRMERLSTLTEVLGIFELRVAGYKL